VGAATAAGSVVVVVVDCRKAEISLTSTLLDSSWTLLSSIPNTESVPISGFITQLTIV
jgi:hypothetical protein